MKKFMKQWMTLALAVMMLVTAVPMGNVEAKAKKLGKKDFEYTFEGKKHDFVTEKKQYEWSWFVFYDIPESKYCKDPGKTMKTKRNVKLGSTESKVTKQYGKATKKKVSKTERYYKKIKYDVPEIDTSNWKNYLEYTYKKGKDNYKLRFYLDKKNKVTAFVYFKNLHKIDNYPNTEGKVNLSFKAPKGKKIKTKTIGGKKVYILPKGTQLCWNKKKGVTCSLAQYNKTGKKVATGYASFYKNETYPQYSSIPNQNMEDVLKRMYRVNSKTGYTMTSKNGTLKYINPNKLGGYRYFVMTCNNYGESGKKAPYLIYFRYE